MRRDVAKRRFQGPPEWVDKLQKTLVDSGRFKVRRVNANILDVPAISPAYAENLIGVYGVRMAKPNKRGAWRFIRLAPT